eukprot:TRINITY_DN5531_c0_g3_i11.p1 TRINITY_DN5531_c0_g3~~TRINITY_DN5531_c0_g3_i11.p1  ORF type:complete len:114 (-),score=45.66 TRINITY_DN5531_c0_g3_i11:148-489(-)
MTASEKLLIVQETSTIIEEFVAQVQKVKELESYLTFDPIYDLPEKQEKLNKCEIVHLNQAAQVSRLNQEVTELLKNYSSLVAEINKKCVLYDYILNILEKQPDKNTKDISLLI